MGELFQQEKSKFQLQNYIPPLGDTRLPNRPRTLPPKRTQPFKKILESSRQDLSRL